MHKPFRTHVTNGTPRQKQTKAKDSGVPKIKGNLQKTMHVCFCKKIVDGVQEQISRTESAREQTSKNQSQTQRSPPKFSNNHTHTTVTYHDPPDKKDNHHHR
jgi:hypothetical protein